MQARRYRVPALLSAGLLAVALTAAAFAAPSVLIAAKQDDAAKSSVESVFVQAEDADAEDELAKLEAELALETKGDDDKMALPKPKKGKNCADMTRGNQCYKDVHYAMDHIKAHPDWYVGLTEQSSPYAFQDFLHKQMVHGKPRCPKPCSNWKKDKRVSIYGKCHTTKEGEDCYNHVLYTQKENLPKHPEWYPGLNTHASFLEIQDYLHKQRVCPEPCGLKAAKERAKKKQINGEKLCEHKKGKAKLKCLDDADEASGVCHDAKPGEGCYGDVEYARKELKAGKHEEWYLGLKPSSSWAEYQAFLHFQNSADTSRLCPLPCNRKAVAHVRHYHGRHCATAAPGEECWKAAVWVIHTGIKKHPKWYKNVSSTWTLERVQDRLADDKHSDCKNPSCPCHTAEEGEKCFSSVKWVMSTGIKNHSKWYKGLTPKSTWEEVQMRLHSESKTHCKLPCAKTPWLEKSAKKHAPPPPGPPGPPR